MRNARITRRGWKRRSTSRVYPAYQKLIDYFNASCRKTTTDDGVWKLPDGDAFYATCCARTQRRTLKPDEVHELGLREVARIEAEMRAHSRCARIRGPADRRINGSAGQGSAFPFSNDDKGRADALAEYTRLITQATERSKQLFLTVPKAKIEVRRVPEFKEATVGRRLLSRRGDGRHAAGNFLRQPSRHE